MDKRLLLILFVFLLGGKLLSQEVRNSQFYSLPTLLNAANTGSSVHNLRIGVSYKNQLSSVYTPFSSQAAYIDTKLQSYFIESSWIGLGTTFLNESAGEGLKSTYVGLNLALHKSLSVEHNLIFSTGISLISVNKYVDNIKLVFDDQWDGSVFNPSYHTEEPLESISLWYADVAVGAKITYYKKRDIYSFGLSITHINQPSESFYNNANNMGKRLSFQGDVEKWFNDGNSMLNSCLVVDVQSYETTAIIGTNIYRTFPSNRFNGIIAGVWYRTSNEIIPSVGVEFDSIKVIASYDISLTNSAYKNAGGFEISLTYSLGDSNPIDQLMKRKNSKSTKNRKGAVPCPKFKGM